MAQEERVSAVTAAAPVERIRFAASPASVQIRIEVRSAVGALVDDSDWRNGNVLDWLPQDRSEQPLTWGAYRQIENQHRTNEALEQRREALERNLAR